MVSTQNFFASMMLFVALFLTVSSTLLSLCNDFPDCRSLLLFKSAITSDPHDNLQGWNGSDSFCKWNGIKCHPRHKNYIISLDLANMSLQGKISPFLANISLLTTINLQDNGFYGEIPASLGMLSELVHINVSGNNLQGNIPAGLQGCRNLKIVDLTYNNLSGSIPDEIGALKSLTYLALAVNRLSGVIPHSLLNLTELTDLELAVNYFSGKIPPEIGELKKLEIMYFHTNYFSGKIPAAISNCTSLLEITLSENSLTGEIPIELGSGFPNLQTLYFLMNQLSGQIPATLSNLSQLTLLDVSLNNLTGEVPLELGKLSKLQILYLHSNYLVSGSSTPSMPFLTTITNCSLLEKLHLGSNFFTGSLPFTIGDLSKNLYYFNLLNNRISGNIPSSIGNLSSLIRLTLWDNYLNGTIPSTFGELQKLQILDLGQNKLQGPIPDNIGGMVNLGLLGLNDNLISGLIPTSLGNLSQLRYLYLSHNRLSGTIPSELTRCSQLMLLDLSFNKLQGSPPTEIGLLSNLALSLNFSNNYLQGELPRSLGNLASVQAIDMSENQLSSIIPSSIESCISLEYLNLSNNLLEGSIPEHFSKLKYMKSLDLAFNHLTGKIPISLGEVQTLFYLNLSYNRLTGEVPRMGSFKNLGRRSFMGNAGLCSGSASMVLPPCEVEKKTKQQKKNKLVYVVIPIVGSCVALLLCILAVALVCRHLSGKEKKEQLLSMDLPLWQESSTRTQRELEIATGGFHEDNILGRGSFGTVYKATINGGRTVVAVKVLHQFCEQGYKSFKRECWILSGIKHRNLVTVLGAIWNAEFKALVLQFVGNGNLEQHLYPDGSEGGEGCKLTMRERLRIAIDIAHGLEYLHEGCSVQIVHCDLKPSNVLLDEDIVPHLADFGIAKLISADRPNGDVTSTTTAFLRGSVGYIPPEYGQGIEVSEKGDVYSFGVMVLEIVTRKRPTSSTFSEGLDLRKWVSFSFPGRVLDVVDISLIREAENCGAGEMLEQCCIQMINIGLMCMEENPQKRPAISLVTRKLEEAWKEMKF